MNLNQKGVYVAALNYFEEHSKLSSHNSRTDLDGAFYDDSDSIEGEFIYYIDDLPAGFWLHCSQKLWEGDTLISGTLEYRGEWDIEKLNNNLDVLVEYQGEGYLSTSDDPMNLASIEVPLTHSEQELRSMHRILNEYEQDLIDTIDSGVDIAETVSQVEDELNEVSSIQHIEEIVGGFN
jgi:hypothetical protein